MRPEILFVPAVLIIVYLIPIIVGFTWIHRDADRSGQPGLLWAVLSIPLGWLSVLVYLASRANRATTIQVSPSCGSCHLRRPPALLTHIPC